MVRSPTTIVLIEVARDTGRLNTHAMLALEMEQGVDVADAQARGRRGSLVFRVLPLLLSVAAVGSWSESLRSIHPYRATAIGLIGHLHFLWWVGLLLAVTAILVELWRDSPRVTFMVPALVAFALILHGTLPATETVPRFSSAYTVAGFSNYLEITGHALPRIDVRMSWPAIFAAAGMAARSMGVSTLWFLRWCPFILNLAYLFPLKAISNTCLRTGRARWAALAIFLASNWIDQDYFSPQGLNLFLFLAAVAILIRVFASSGNPPRLVQYVFESDAGQRIRRFSTNALRLPYAALKNEHPERVTTVRHRLAMLAILLVILGATAVTHQITPAALCLVFLGFTLTGRTNLRMLWMLMAVLVWAWLSWEAYAYWSGHLSKLFGSAGQVGSTLNSTVGARLKSPSHGRSLVQDGRLAASVLTWLGAMAGTWALWRRGRTMWTMVIVAVAPVAVAGAVSYGGEVALRVLLFSLAPAAVLTASLIDYERLRRGSVLFCLAIAVGLLVLFPLDRFGNESFEAIAPGDLTAASWIHTHVARGADIYITSRDEPLLYANVGFYKQIEFGVLLNLTGAKFAQQLPISRVPSYVFLTRSEDNYGIDYLGDPSNWLTRFEFQLLKTGYVHVVYKNSTAEVMQIVKKPRPRHIPPVIPKHPKTPVVITPRPKPIFHPHPKPIPVHRTKPTPTTRPKPIRPPKPPRTTTTTTPSTTTTTPSTTTTTTTPSTTTTTPSTTAPPTSATASLSSSLTKASTFSGVAP